MACSSSKPCVVVEVVEEHQYQYQYPYPSNVYVANFVSVKLSRREIYGVWKMQMLCLLTSHQMLGFVNGEFERPPKNRVLGKEKVGDYILWERSDGLVKGWILGSLSEQTLRYVVNLAKTNENITAKDVWDKLQTLYCPPSTLLRQQTVLVDEEEINKITSETNPIKEGDSISEIAQSIDKQIERQKDRLYRAILRGRWEYVDTILKEGKVSLTDKLAINGNTGLHVVVGTTKKKEVLHKILNSAIKDNPQLDMKNAEGSTLLHVASIVGNTEAAKILVIKNQELLKAKDNDGDTPLKKALSNMHTEKVLAMLNHDNAKDIEMGTILKGTSGEELMVNTISSKDFVSAQKLVINRCETMNSDAVLMAMAQNFPSRPLVIEKFVYKLIKATQTKPNAKYFRRSCQRFYQEKINFLSRTCCVGVLLLNYACAGIYWLFMAIPCLLVWPFKFVEVKVKRYSDAVKLLKKLCNLIKDNDKLRQSNSVHQYYTNTIFEASRQNAHEVVEILVSYFPNAIWSTNEDGHNIIQHAVINRSEKVYNLLYQMSEHKNIYKTIIDASGNNLLHLVATLAPNNKLNLISGAALQIQHELQWFQEVKRFVCPLNVMQKNLFKETPQMIFTREHKELVIEGEKWMKTTSESYSITAALITTIMFAAAITVPGGNTQDTGIPIFTHKAAFSVFAVSDAISLFTSVTSLLMFLSILTARFAEQDFLFRLPTKLVIGLVTLFVSTTAMIIAFGATLFLVFGRSRSWILIPIGLLTCLPIASFVTLQLPLVWDFISSTYGRSIFGKKSAKPFY